MYDADETQIAEPFEDGLIRDWFFPISRGMGLYGPWSFRSRCSARRPISFSAKSPMEQPRVHTCSRPGSP